MSEPYISQTRQNFKKSQVDNFDLPGIHLPSLPHLMECVKSCLLKDQKLELKNEEMDSLYATWVLRNFVL